MCCIGSQRLESMALLSAIVIVMIAFLPEEFAIFLVLYFVIRIFSPIFDLEKYFLHTRNGEWAHSV